MGSFRTLDRRRDLPGKRNFLAAERDVASAAIVSSARIVWAGKRDFRTLSQVKETIAAAIVFRSR
jgi:hypothetical protein